jgi:hypothetical protein
MFLLAVSFATGKMQAQAPRSGGGPAQIPPAVYSRLFREVVNMEARADRLASDGQPDASVRHYHQLWLGLAPDQESELKQVAAGWSRQNAPLATQAASARNELRRLQHESSGASPDSERSALAATASQQLALVQSARGSLADVFGPARMAYFESILRRYAVSKISKAPLPRENCAADCPMPTGENAPGTWWDDGGVVGAYFIVQLVGPAGASFTGRAVQEVLGQEADGCHATYPGAGLPLVPKPTPGVWVVSDYNILQNTDGIELGTYWANGYTAYMWALLVASGQPQNLPYTTCAISNTQQMQIDSNCNLEAPAWASYTTNNLQWTIWPDFWQFCTTRGAAAVCGGGWH